MTRYGNFYHGNTVIAEGIKMTQDKTDIDKQRQLPDLEWDIEHIDKHWLGSDSLDADCPHSQLANSCWERVKSEISKLQAKVQELEKEKQDVARRAFDAGREMLQTYETGDFRYCKYLKYEDYEKSLSDKEQKE